MDSVFQAVHNMHKILCMITVYTYYGNYTTIGH